MQWMENRAGSPNPNAPWSLCITPEPNPVFSVGSGYPNRIFKLALDGEVIGGFGHTGKGPGEFGWVHGLAYPSENVVFAADELHPAKAAEAAAVAAQK
jgi:hypothetical protein